MTKLILDDVLRAKLDLASATTEVCESDGTTVAYVVSAEQYRRLLYGAMAARHTDERAALSWADFERNGGVSTREAWEYVDRRMSEREGAA